MASVNSKIVKIILLATGLFLSLNLWINPARASIELNERFKATEACEAFQSIRKGTNPGNIKLTPNTIYPVIAKNQKEETHYSLIIDGAEPSARWVSIDCGQLLGIPVIEDLGSQTSDYLLAISWQPAFCETHPDKTECQTQTMARFDASNFTLHGLWPKPQYCNVSDEIEKLDRNGKWSKLPALDLSDELKNELAIKMPGVASNLHLHEWYKHGTCYSATPEKYYKDSLALLDRVNNSGVRTLFAGNIDETITSDAIRINFNNAFRNNAGERVSIKCVRDIEPTKRNMIQELKINLKGTNGSAPEIEEWFKNGKKVEPDCPLGEVDRAGFN